MTPKYQIARDLIRTIFMVAIIFAITDGDFYRYVYAATVMGVAYVLAMFIAKILDK